MNVLICAKIDCSRFDFRSRTFDSTLLLFKHDSLIYLLMVNDGSSDRINRERNRVLILRLYRNR